MDRHHHSCNRNLSLGNVFLWLIVIVLVYVVEKTSAHGRLEEPAARNCAWRFGYKTPENYNDNELNCGGVGQQWTTNGGKCGVCGDPFHGVRNHEAGGKYATGTIVRTYNRGQIIDITVRLSANHLGTMEFRLCPVDDKFVEASQECLDQNVLQIIGHGTGYPVKSHENLIHLQFSGPDGAKLPDDITCSQCVLQWKYRAGNNWGSLPNGRSGLGVGPQEEFYNCADVAIRNEAPESHVSFEFLTTPKPPKQPKTTTATSPPTTTTVTEPTSDYEEIIITSESSSSSSSTSTTDYEMSSSSSTTSESTSTVESELVESELDDESAAQQHHQQLIEQSEQDELLDSITAPPDEQPEHEEVTVSSETPIPIPVFSQLLQLLLNGNGSPSMSGEVIPSDSSSSSYVTPAQSSSSSSSFFHCERLPLSLVPFIETAPDPNEYKGIPLCLLIGDDPDTSCKDCYERCITPLKECPRQFCYCKWYV